VYSLGLLLREVAADDLLAPHIEFPDRVPVVEVDGEEVAVCDALAGDHSVGLFGVGSGGVEVQRELGVVACADLSAAEVDGAIVESFVAAGFAGCKFGLLLVSMSSEIG